MAAARSSSETSARPHPAPRCHHLRLRPALGPARPSRPRSRLPRPAGPTSAAARSHGAAEVAAWAKLTRLLRPLLRPPPPPSLPRSRRPLMAAAAATAPPPHKMARAQSLRTPRRHRLSGFAAGEPGPGKLSQGKVEGRTRTPTGAGGCPG